MAATPPGPMVKARTHQEVEHHGLLPSQHRRTPRCGKPLSRSRSRSARWDRTSGCCRPEVVTDLDVAVTDRPPGSARRPGKHPSSTGLAPPLTPNGLDGSRHFDISTAFPDSTPGIMTMPRLTQPSALEEACDASRGSDRGWGGRREVAVSNATGQ